MGAQLCCDPRRTITAPQPSVPFRARERLAASRVVPQPSRAGTERKRGQRITSARIGVRRMTDKKSFARLLVEVRACKICAPNLPLGPRPIVRGRPSARLLIISQAPGRRVHETRKSFNDRSGDRLRAWLAMDRETFYDEAQVAILGMAFCYPGSDGKGGDLPPRPECAPHWHRSEE